MPKRASSNNRPWLENFIYDFNLSPSTTPSEAETFINSLSTSDKNKAFLRLRYIEGKSYADIAPAYGISAGGVRQAVKYVMERYLKSRETAPGDDLLSGLKEDNDVDQAVEVPSEAIDITDDAPGDAADIADDDAPSDAAATPAAPAPVSPTPKKVREELKPIITAIATTTRQRTFVYDTKMRIVLSSDNVPRGLRRDSRYVPLPDYYQIKEYDLMQDFAASLADTDPDKSDVLSTALNGLGPFKAFRNAVRDIGLGQAWADFRFQRFADMAEEWWEREVAPVLAARADEGGADTASVNAGPHSSPSVREGSSENRTEGDALIVSPAALNGIALIETIRILYRRVGPADFEEALDELRDCLCALSGSTTEAE